MPGLNFFLVQTQNEKAAIHPLPHHRLSDKQLQTGIIAFNAGLAALKDKETNRENDQGTDPQPFFENAVKCFTQAIRGQTNNMVSALAHGYLALIRFDGLDGKEKQQDITEDMLSACEAINALAQTDKGLEDMPQDFIALFKNMIAKLHEMRPEYMSADSEESKTWHVRLIKAKREHMEALESQVGVIVARQQAEQFYEQLLKNISILNESASLLEKNIPLMQTTHSDSTTPSLRLSY